MKLFTIGFTKKSAAEFFGLLEANGVKKIIDTRFNNTSQLAGFAKGKDLDYFAGKILQIEYEYQESYAPTKDLLSRYRYGSISWDGYEDEYLGILKHRNILKTLEPSKLDHACLLCSEQDPDQCHRRLLAEYIKQAYPDVEIIHLK